VSVYGALVGASVSRNSRIIVIATVEACYFLKVEMCESVNQKENKKGQIQAWVLETVTPSDIVIRCVP
jgi:hypothetical protein